METLTVSQFNRRVYTIISSNDTVRELAVVGEISKVSRSPSGHVYIDLKDSESVVKCTLFKGPASRLKFIPRDGMKVTVYGDASYYVKGGSLNFNIFAMEEYGKGDAQRALEELTSKLRGEGLFDDARKKPIPKYPRTIGVVTSHTGAVIKDIMDTVARRGYPVNILLSPSTVQGDTAPASIVAAIQLLAQQDIDVLIIGRGGGSKEDLIAFNSESVVRAVALCEVPVISAVGHATDKSLCDLAADKYAETPTAAAMIATPDANNELRNLDDLSSSMSKSLLNIITRIRSKFDVIDSKLSLTGAGRIIQEYRVRLDAMNTRLNSSLTMKSVNTRNSYNSLGFRIETIKLIDKIQNGRRALETILYRANSKIVSQIESIKSQLSVQSAVLDSLSLEKTLLKGFSLVTDSEDNILSSVSHIRIGSVLFIKMGDGTVVAEVKELRKNG
ncbi:MAG: exodeoxyribonuclease VII large subunit [archaeon]|nr:exodeoxyribonuclease VII large subunit [archaeon]